MSCSDREVRSAVALAVIAFVVVGCTAQYRPGRSIFARGVDEERLGARTWIVRAGAGWPNEGPRLGQFALYRAAEIATAHGFTHFVILDGGDAVADAAVYGPTAPMPEPIERDESTRPTWKQRYGFEIPILRTQVARLRVRLVPPEEIHSSDTVIEVEKVVRRLNRVVRR